MPKAVRQTSDAVVLDQLRRAIVLGWFEPGQKLVQTDLAEELGVSTTPVREALRTLANEGLVTIDAYRGAEVHAPSHKELRDVYELRLMLEPLAIEKAVRLASPAEIEFAEGLSDRMIAEDDPIAWLEINRDFHNYLVSLSGNKSLVSVLGTLRDQATGHIAWALRMQPSLTGGANSDHVELLDAVSNGDVGAAKATTIEHLRRTMRTILADPFPPDSSSI